MPILGEDIAFGPTNMRLDHTEIDARGSASTIGQLFPVQRRV
jgi:hypothetical protein